MRRHRFLLAAIPAAVLAAVRAVFIAPIDLLLNDYSYSYRFRF